jgi:hypothetical protein
MATQNMFPLKAVFDQGCRLLARRRIRTRLETRGLKVGRSLELKRDTITAVLLNSSAGTSTPTAKIHREKSAPKQSLLNV